MADITVAELVDGAAPGFVVALAARQAAARELEPDVPPIGPRELTGQLFSPPPHRPVQTWTATLGGEPAGVLSVERFRDDGLNDHRAFLYADVIPEVRGRGVGRALVDVAVAALDDEVTELIGQPLAAPGAKLCESLGLTHRQDERYSRMLVADVDAEQQRQWIDDAPGRGKGYQVVCWIGPCPDEHLDGMCAALDAMADAPLDDTEWVTPPTTPERLRAAEACDEARTWVRVSALALAPDGAPAGMTELFVVGERPQVAEQGDTAVIAAHRGHGLGRWLKAANLAQARAAYPELAVVGTYNAESNPWMLGINVAMGFRPHVTFPIYQGPRPKQG